MTGTAALLPAQRWLLDVAPPASTTSTSSVHARAARPASTRRPGGGARRRRRPPRRPASPLRADRRRLAGGVHAEPASTSSGHDGHRRRRRRQRASSSRRGRAPIAGRARHRSRALRAGRAPRPRRRAGRHGCSWPCTTSSSTACRGESCSRTCGRRTAQLVDAAAPSSLPAKTSSIGTGPSTSSSYADGAGDASTSSNAWNEQADADTVAIPVRRRRRATCVARRRRRRGRSRRQRPRERCSRPCPASSAATSTTCSLAALARTLTRWCGRDTISIDVEAHGREELARTSTCRGPSDGSPRSPRRVAPCSTTRRSPTSARSIGAQARHPPASRARLRRPALPLAGSRCPGPARCAPAAADQLQLPRPVRRPGDAAATARSARAAEPAGPMRHPDGARAYLIEVDASVVGERADVRVELQPRAPRRMPDPRPGRRVCDRAAAEPSPTSTARRRNGLVSRPPASPDRPRHGVRPAERPHRTGRAADVTVTVRDVYDLTPLQQGCCSTRCSSRSRSSTSSRSPSRSPAPLALAGVHGAPGRTSPITTTRCARRSTGRASHAGAGRARRRADERRRRSTSRGIRAHAGRGRSPTADRGPGPGFDLERPPLFRVALVRVGAGDVRLVLSFHHIILDGWSLQLLFRDFGIGVRRRGSPAGTPTAPGRAATATTSCGSRAGPRRGRGATGATHLAGYARAAAALVGAGDDGDGEPFGEHEASCSRAGDRRPLSAPPPGAASRSNTVAQAAWALALGVHRRPTTSSSASPCPAGPASSPASSDGRAVHQHDPGARRASTPTPAWRTWLRRRAAAASSRPGSTSTRRSSRSQQWSGLPAGTPLFDTIVAFENYPIAGGQRRPTPAVTGDVRRADELPAERGDRARGAAPAPAAVRRAPPAIRRPSSASPSGSR